MKRGLVGLAAVVALGTGCATVDGFAYTTYPLMGANGRATGWSCDTFAQVTENTTSVKTLCKRPDEPTRNVYYGTVQTKWDSVDAIANSDEESVYQNTAHLSEIGTLDTVNEDGSREPYMMSTGEDWLRK